jgi:hypothetical protein
MPAMTVTATQGGSTANGLALRVFVLTGAASAAAQSGASTNNQFLAATTWTQSITTTAGSNVYGAASHFGSNDVATASNATIVDDIADATNSERYVTFKALNVTSGATTRGFTLGAGDTGPFAQLEILAAGTLAEDASSPAVASTTSATTVTTASFTPPAGSLLVALVGSDGGATVTTMTVSGGGLTWVEKVKNNPSGGDYAGVWIADVPGAVSAYGPATNLQQYLLRDVRYRRLITPRRTSSITPQLLAFNGLGGTSGVTVANTDTGVGNPWDTVTMGTGVTFAYDNSHGANQNCQSILVATTGTSAQSFGRWTTSFVDADIIWFSMYLYFAANPSVTFGVVLGRHSGDSINCGQWRINNSGQIVLSDTTVTGRATSVNSSPMGLADTWRLGCMPMTM